MWPPAPRPPAPWATAVRSARLRSSTSTPPSSSRSPRWAPVASRSPSPGSSPAAAGGDDGRVTHTRTQLAALLEQHGLGPSRALGQNFVVDPNTVRRIARLAGVGPGTPVVEIGAGLGSLTLALAETGASVTAVETDRHLVPVLRAVVAGHDVRVIAGDAMRLDWGDVLAGHDRWVLVANLPY